MSCAMSVESRSAENSGLDALWIMRPTPLPIPPPTPLPSLASLTRPLLSCSAAEDEEDDDDEDDEDEAEEDEEAATDAPGPPPSMMPRCTLALAVDAKRVPFQSYRCTSYLICCCCCRCEEPAERGTKRRLQPTGRPSKQ
jgi:hypothetical protein